MKKQCISKVSKITPPFSFNRLPIIRNCVSQNLEARHVPSSPPAEHYQINESKTHDRRVIGQTPIKREKKSVNRRGGVSSSFLGANDRRGNELPDVLKLSSIPLRGAPRLRANSNSAKYSLCKIDHSYKPSIKRVCPVDARVDALTPLRVHAGPSSSSSSVAEGRGCKL